MRTSGWMPITSRQCVNNHHHSSPSSPRLTEPGFRHQFGSLFWQQYSIPLTAENESFFTPLKLTIQTIGFFAKQHKSSNCLGCACTGFVVVRERKVLVYFDDIAKYKKQLQNWPNRVGFSVRVKMTHFPQSKGYRQRSFVRDIVMSKVTNH
jgi:hypothetical protein